MTPEVKEALKLFHYDLEKHYIDILTKTIIPIYAVSKNEKINFINKNISTDFNNEKIDFDNKSTQQIHNETIYKTKIFDNLTKPSVRYFILLYNKLLNALIFSFVIKLLFLLLDNVESKKHLFV